jgi:hypothetical protein
MNLKEIKLRARNLNNRDLYLAIEDLCDYVAEIEKSVEDLQKLNQPKGEPSKEDIKKKGSK